MSSLFSLSAEDMAQNAPAPDAEAKTIVDAPEDTPKKRRGRQLGQKNKAKAAVAVSTPEEFINSAKAINTIVFSAACVFTSTKEAWPSDGKIEVMDKALARYMEVKNFSSPPEFALIAAYAAYAQEIAVKKEVQENLAKRFGGFFGKFSFIRKFTDKFKRNPKT